MQKYYLYTIYLSYDHGITNDYGEKDTGHGNLQQQRRRMPSPRNNVQEADENQTTIHQWKHSPTENKPVYNIDKFLIYHELVVSNDFQ